MANGIDRLQGTAGKMRDLTGGGALSNVPGPSTAPRLSAGPIAPIRKGLNRGVGFGAGADFDDLRNIRQLSECDAPTINYRRSSAGHARTAQSDQNFTI